MYARHVTTSLLAALADTPVVFLAGARQTGKSTLAKHVAASGHPSRYVTLDDLGTLAAARRDPVGFVAGLGGAAVIDEVQRVPDLLLAIKASVDRDRRSGRFLLTGSANVLALPHVADALAGRMEVVTLWPLSQGEMAGRREAFIDVLFGPDPPTPGSAMATFSREELCQRIALGGFPEVQARPRPARRRAWFRSYLTTLFQRDVRDLAAIEGLAELPQLVGLLAARTGSQVSFADISRTAGIPQTTLKRYMALLEALYVVYRLQAWSGNLSARLLKAPKLYLTDAGLAADLVGLDAAGMLAHSDRLGPLLETFVVGELQRQCGWSRTSVRPFHFRTEAGREVDIVLEDHRGACVAIEVKAAATPSARDVAGIEAFAALTGNRFHRGVVLYTGTEIIPFGANIHAVPLTALWEMGAQ